MPGTNKYEGAMAMTPFTMTPFKTGPVHHLTRLAALGILVAAALSVPMLTPRPAAGVPVVTAARCTRPVALRADRFDHPTKVNNRWLPLVPGTRFVLEGSVNSGGGSSPHQVIFTVTELTKVLDGIKTRVVLDLDLDEGVLQEAELAFFAQDNDANVWSLGEYPEEYSDGAFTGAPNTWITGLAGAKGGIMMLADPQVGGPRYVQGSAPRIDFLDCGQVFAKSQNICVPADCYTKVLVTDENSPLDPDSGHQRKFYAPGVGNVAITAVDDPQAETLQLTHLVQLSRGALDEANAAALTLDRHGYEVSKVYARTPHAKLP
jgi:hypothetical protein